MFDNYEMRKNEMNLAPQRLNDLAPFRKVAFTLAEVLITLGIIGVVAALTIPTLVAGYQRKSWDTAASVFDKKFTETLKTMNVQGKLGSYGGYSTTEGFVEELQKHFKINKVCDNANLMQCFDDKITMNGVEIDMTNIKTAEGFGQPDWGTNIIGLQVADGTTALVAYNPQCKANPYDNTITGADCVAILYDTSGFSGPNEMSNDVGQNKSVKSLSGKSCAFEIGGTCFGVPFKPTAISKADCESLKGTLNITTCLSDNDYWAGAAKECKGTGNMATQADLNKLANALYNTTGITDNSANVTLDTEKAGKYGFKDSSFYVWSGEEDSTGSSQANDRWFSSSATVKTANNRTSSDHYAVCITK